MFGGGPGDAEEANQGAGAAHGLGAQPVSFADDDAEKRGGHVGAGVEQSGAVADQGGSLDFRAHHDAGAVDQTEHGDIKAVA